MQKYGPDLPKLKLFTIDRVFGGWQKAQATHFADGGGSDFLPRLIELPDATGIGMREPMVGSCGHIKAEI